MKANNAINYIADITNWLYAIIPAGAIFMITYQSFRKLSASADDGVVSDANQKIKKTIIGAVIGISLPAIITLIKSFYN